MKKAKLSDLDRIRLKNNLTMITQAVTQAVDKLKGIDVKKEYKLILEKKSQLSRSKRDLVVEKYNQNLSTGEII